METNSGIDPDLEKFADNIILSSLSMIVGSISTAALIRYNTPILAPFSVVGGIEAVEKWRTSWVYWDAHKASTASHSDT